MQNFESAGVLGTPVAVPLPSVAGIAVKDSLSQEIFDNSLNFIESVDEKNIIFRRQAPVLQGMQTTRVQTGGRQTVPPGLIVGASVDGIQYDHRLDHTVFGQPGQPAKRVSIAPDRPLTGENGETVYRDGAESVVRQKRGAMSVRRFDQETAIARKKQRASREKMLADVPITPSTTSLPTVPAPLAVPMAPSTLTQAPGPAPAPTPTLGPAPTLEPTSYAVTYPRLSDATWGPYSPSALSVLAQVQAPPSTPSKAATNFADAMKTSATRLHANTRHLVTGQMPIAEYFQRFVDEQHWILACVGVTTVCVLALLIVAIVVSVRSASIRRSNAGSNGSGSGSGSGGG